METIDNKKHICIIVPTLHKGGLERVASLLANEISSKGYKVSIIIIIPGLSIDFDINNNIQIISPIFNYDKGLIFKFKALIYMIKSLRTLKPDAILSFGEVFNPLSIIASKILNMNIYISDRSSPKLKLPITDVFLKKVTYPLAKGLMAQTNLAKDSLLKYNSNIEVIPNPLRVINDNYPKNLNNKIIVSVGRLVKSKNFKTLIEIFHNINRLDWKLYIVGDGTDYDNLREYITDLNLTNNVILTGKQDDVDKYFSEASIFAFTSLSEGFPNALNEAMAFPLPVVSFDCVAGPKDLIIDKFNGILIDINDKKSFETALICLMDNEAIRENLKTNSYRNRIIYSRDIVTKKILNFILN